MAGHSKWNNIKNRKGAVDAKRAKAFTQAAKLIKSAIKEGHSPDPAFNPALRAAVEKARAANMPKDKIDKAIERSSGKTAAGVILHEVMYEGYGGHGEAYLVSCVTDNLNRTASEIKSIFGKHGGALSGPNSAKFLFSLSPEHEFIPLMPLVLEDNHAVSQIQELFDALTEQEDVDEVVTSAQLPQMVDETE